jgi:hypothetical protein
LAFGSAACSGGVPQLTICAHRSAQQERTARSFQIFFCRAGVSEWVKRKARLPPLQHRLRYFLRDFKRNALCSTLGNRTGVGSGLRSPSNNFHRCFFSNFFSFNAYQPAQGLEQLESENV